MTVPRRLAVAAIILSMALPHPTFGQWALSLDAQRSAYGGTSEDTSSQARTSLRPAKTTALTLRSSRQWGRITAGLGVRVAWASLIAEAPGIAVSLDEEFNFIEALPEVSWQVLRTSRGATLDVYGGPVLGVWRFEDLSGRFVAGAAAGSQAQFPVFERLAMSLRVGGSIMRSVFRDGDLPPEVVTRPMRRSEISLGLRYRL